MQDYTGGERHREKVKKNKAKNIKQKTVLLCVFL